MLSCHATSLSGWAVPGSPATFSRPDQASCRKKKAQKAKSRKSARPPCGNCHTRIFLVYAFRKAGAFCESIISACDVTADPRQKKPQQALSEPGSAAVGRSMACTQGNGICRRCFCKSHFSRKAFLCPFFPSPRMISPSFPEDFTRGAPAACPGCSSVKRPRTGLKLP